MSSWKHIRNIVLALAIASLTACGQPGGAALAPWSGSDAEALDAQPIEVSFNDTYLERVELNEATAHKNPYNTDKGLFKQLKKAKKSLDGAFYDIEDEGVIDAFIAAKKRGVTIRLVTDSDNMVEKSDPSKPREAIKRLKAAGIPIVEDNRSGIMHHKFLVVDGKTLWMGSTNLTPTSLYRHNNNALTLRSKELAQAFTVEFERLFLEREFGKSTRGGVTPPTRVIKTSMGEVQAFFSPAGGGREAVVAELAKANKRIRFMTFSLTDPETGNLIMAKAKSGVMVEGIMDRWLAAGEYSLFSTFKDAGLKVLRDGNEALMHHKVIVIDDRTVITGSYNYSQNAEHNNNEAFLIIRKSPRLGRAYAREFDRLQYAAKHNRPPAKRPDDPEHKTGNER